MPARVLVADDSLNIQRTVAHILKEAGIDAVTVGNGEHAVRRLADIKPDLILADVFMPVRSGFEVCEYVKNSEHFAHVPVLLLASTMEPYDEKEAQRVRADGRLTKPFKDPSATLATIQEWLAKAANAHPAAPPAPEPVATAPPPAPPTVEPEPLPELYATRPPHVTFGPGEAPMG
ncbi:MAG: response regulator, partial [Acidobacteria bacterium]|nr:response regulator [Acidobacteriota bacterium]